MNEQETSENGPDEDELASTFVNFEQTIVNFSAEEAPSLREVSVIESGYVFLERYRVKDELGKGAMDQLIALWFGEASIVLRERTNKIVAARFIEQSPRHAQSRRATCVKSATPATPNLLNARAGFYGLEVYYQ